MSLGSGKNALMATYIRAPSLEAAILILGGLERVFSTLASMCSRCLPKTAISILRSQFYRVLRVIVTIFKDQGAQIALVNILFCISRP